MTLTTLMRIAREGSLATVLAVALVAVPSLAFAGPTPTTTASTPHAGSHTPLPAVHGTDPGNHGAHGGSTSTGTPSVPGSTTGSTTTDPNATTANAGSSIGMEVTGGVLIGLGILMLLLKGNSKAQSVLQGILQAVGMGSVLNGGGLGNGGIINMLGSLLTALNGGTNPLGNAANTIGSIASTIGGAGTLGSTGTIDNSNVGLNAERVTLTSGAIAIQTVRDATQIGFGRKGARSH